MDKLTNKIMENTKNTDSWLGGIWFYFSDGDRSIIIHGGSFSGRETIFVDGTKVSQKRSWRQLSEHVFNYQGDSFKVTYQVLSHLKGILKVDVLKNGVLLDSEIRDTVESLTGYQFSRKKKNIWLEILGWGICGGLVGLVVGFVSASGWSFFSVS